MRRSLRHYGLMLMAFLVLFGSFAVSQFGKAIYDVFFAR